MSADRRHGRLHALCDQIGRKGPGTQMLTNKRTRAALGGLLIAALLVAGCGPGALSDRPADQQPIPSTNPETSQAPLSSPAAVADSPPATPTVPIQEPSLSRPPGQPPEGRDDATVVKQPGAAGAGPDRADPPVLPGAPVKPTASSGFDGAREFTWRDGEQTKRVYLTSDLIVVADEDISVAGSEVVARGVGQTIVRQPVGAAAQPVGQPVFRSPGGELLTLPGGVIVVFDPAWARSRIDQFFVDHAVPAGRVQARDYLPNAFFVTTEPGFPSLDLANRLAGTDGVLISSPNWQTETATR